MRWNISLALVALALPVMAQVPPKPTEVGTRALEELARRCIAGGGLKEEKDPQSGETTWIATDGAKLKAAVAADRAALTRELCDSLVARWRMAKPGGDERVTVITLLRSMGEASGDPRASAFAAFLQAMRSRPRDADAAIASFQEAADRFRACEEPAWQATCINDIGALQYEKGDNARALENYQRSLAIRREALGERHSEVGRIFYNIAASYHAIGDHTRALTEYDRALAALTQVAATSPSGNVPDPSRFRTVPLTVTVLQGRGMAHEEALGTDPAGALRLALGDYRDAADVLDRLRQRVIITDDSRLLHNEENAELFPRTVGVSAKLAKIEGKSDRLRDAFEASERGAARVFVEGLGRSRANVAGRVDPAVLAEEARLFGREAALGRQIDEAQGVPLDKRDREKVGRLLDQQRDCRAELDKLTAKMEREYPQYAALKYPKACSLEEARASLADDEVALSYVLGDAASYLIVLNKRSDPETLGIAVHTLPPAGEIAELVASMVDEESMARSGRARERGAEAFKMLLGPVADAIRGKAMVIVPGRDLGYLPFELLVEPTAGADADDPDAGRFLVEGHRIR